MNYETESETAKTGAAASFESGAAEPAGTPADIAGADTASRAARLYDAMRAAAPGLALSGVVAVCAAVAEAATGLPAMIGALLGGMALYTLARRPFFSAGLILAVKYILRIGIALLGVRIALADVAALGWPIAVLIVVGMAATIVSGLLFARMLKRSGAYGALAGGATAVCGASAALAIQTVLPREKNLPADTVFVVLTVNALSTVAMLAYPLLCSLLGFAPLTTGILLGGTIHDVAQVAGAGYSVSDSVGDTAVIVKLYRVFLLLPVVWILGIYFAGASSSNPARRASVPLPMFAIVFTILAAINSLGLIPADVKQVTAEFSRWSLLIAVAALGLGTSIAALRDARGRDLLIMCGATLVLLAIVLGGLLWLGAI